MSNCQHCKEQNIPLVVDSLPCLDPNALDSSCDSTIDLDDIKYTGPSKLCAGITNGMTARQVLEKLSEYSDTCKCTLQANLTYEQLPCEKGIQLRYDDSFFTSQWQYLNTTTNQYVNISSSSITKSSDENFYYENLSSVLLFGLQSDNYRVILTKPGCNSIVKDLSIAPECEKEEPCVLNDKAYIKNPYTHERLFINVPITTYDSKLLLKYVCDTFPNLTTLQCESYYNDAMYGQSYYSRFSAGVSTYIGWQLTNALAIMSDDTVRLSQVPAEVAAPIPHISDFNHHGIERSTDPNFNWFKIPLKQCPCKLGNQFFYVKYLPHVNTVNALPLTGTLGDVYYVEDVDLYYTWNPQTNSYIDTILFTGTPTELIYAAGDLEFAVSFEDCRTDALNRINAFFTNFNQYRLATLPYYVSQYASLLRDIDSNIRNVPWGSFTKSVSMCNCVDIE